MNEVNFSSSNHPYLVLFRFCNQNVYCFDILGKNYDDTDSIIGQVLIGSSAYSIMHIVDHTLKPEVQKDIIEQANNIINIYQTLRNNA